MHALDGLDLSRAGRRGARLPRPERRRKVHHHPHPARPRARRRRHRDRLRPRPVERRRRRSTAASPTFRATSASGRTSPAARRSTCSPACAAAPRTRRPTPQRKARLVEVFQFDPTKKGRAYSKGNRQKVALIAAFATPADLYILDEPTSGLDPLMEAVFNAGDRRVVGEGATVLLSSHILSEVEQLCDRVSIIRAGKTVETGTLAELRHLTRTEISFAERRRDGCRPSRASRQPTTRGRRRPRALHRRQRRAHRRARRRSRSSRCRACTIAPALARGAVPAPLRRRHHGRDAWSAAGHAAAVDDRSGGGGDPAMRPSASLLRQRLRRDRCSWSSGSSASRCSRCSRRRRSRRRTATTRTATTSCSSRSPTPAILMLRGTPAGHRPRRRSSSSRSSPSSRCWPAS